MAKTTWRKLIMEEMADNPACDSLDNFEAMAPADLDLDREFYAEYGAYAGKSFTLWTKTRVYFPTEHDGWDGVASVPRHPNGEATDHI